MTPKFQELLLQVSPMVGDDDNQVSLPSLHTPQQIERFARLVVEDCLAICCDHLDGAHPEELVDRIKAHFQLS